MERSRKRIAGLLGVATYFLIRANVLMGEITEEKANVLVGVLVVFMALLLFVKEHDVDEQDRTK